jgi:hypothetical protein
LHLPPSGISQHIPAPGEHSTYSDPPPQPVYAAASSGSQMHLGQHEAFLLTMPGQLQQSDRPKEDASDGNGEGTPGPPKKKRRQQPSSCTG